MKRQNKNDTNAVQFPEKSSSGISKQNKNFVARSTEINNTMLSFTDKKHKMRKVSVIAVRAWKMRLRYFFPIEI